jgi:uncharacterized repeat protein (TIGR01451 family)
MYALISVNNLFSIDTYASWAAPNGSTRGYMYIYTCNNPSTNITLTDATTPNTSMVTSAGSWAGVGPLQPAAAIGPFGNTYFRLNTDYPVIWEVEEPILGHWDDSHNLLPAADGTNNFLGSIFMTYMRNDIGDSLDADNPSYGDDTALINPPSAGGNITVNVRKWTGAAWGAVIATSPLIQPGGIWMWSPESAGSTQCANVQGGTTLADSGNYRFDVSGGTAILYKGDAFTPPTGGNRDNLVLFGADLITGNKIGTDLVGACLDQGGAYNIIVNNVDAVAANITIMRFVPNTPGAAWPVSGLDPGGTWTTVTTYTGLAPGASYYFDVNAYGNVAGFYRAVSSNGALLTASFGAQLIDQTWEGGDYLIATDTQKPFGKNFMFGGRCFTGRGPLEIYIIAPNANTQVKINASSSSGVAILPATQTTTVGQAGLAFQLNPGSTDDNYVCNITSSDIIYAYVMSNDSVPAETFFSVPPPVCPLLIASKRADRAYASIGDTVTYCLTLTNMGNSTLSNCVVWDTMPSGMTMIYSSVAPLSPPPSPPCYKWNLGTIAANSYVSVTIAAVVDSGIQLEVKKNTCTGSSDGTSPLISKMVPVTILIPGSDLIKSSNVTMVNPGDTVTYSLAYTNTTPQDYAAISGLDLKVELVGASGQTRAFKYSITNNSGAAISISDLMIISWVYDPTAPSSIGFNCDYGGSTSPYVWGGLGWSGSATAVMPPITTPANRQANMKISWWPTSSDTLPTGTVWNGINLRNVNPSNWSSFSDDYSYESSTSYTDNSSFVLYFQGKPVREQTSPGVDDPDTGCEPNPVTIYDTIPAEINYIGSDAGGTLTANVVSWEPSCIQPMQSITVRWWGKVKNGALPGSVIPNQGFCNSIAGPALSNYRNITLISSYTPTNTPTNKPTNTFTTTPTATPTFTSTYTRTYTITFTPTGTGTPTSSPSYTPTNTYSFTSTFTPVFTRTYTGTFTPSATGTCTQTLTSTFTATYTPTFTHTYTNTSTDTPTFTPTVTSTCTGTATATLTVTDTISSNTPTDTPTVTLTFSPTPSYTATPTLTDTETYTATATPTMTFTYTSSITFTPTGTHTATVTSTATGTITVLSSTPTVTMTATRTYTGTLTQTATQTATETGTFTPTLSDTGTPTVTLTATQTFTHTPTVTQTTSVHPVGISIKKSAAGEDPAVGANITYKISLTNNDNLPAAQICMWDTLPPEVVYSDDNFTVNPVVNGQYLFWKLPDSYMLNPGETVTFELHVVITNLNNGSLVANMAGVDYNDPYYGGITDGTGWVSVKHPPVFSNISFYPEGQPVVYPNPFNPAVALNGRLKFNNLVPGSIVGIYTLSAEMVIIIKSNTTVVEWNGKNSSGSMCSPGIYYYIIKNSGSSQIYKGKIFIIR